MRLAGAVEVLGLLLACPPLLNPSYCLLHLCTTSTFSPYQPAGIAPDVSYVVQGSPADRVFGAFSSLGAIFLLFGLTVLLEIQVRAEAGGWVGCPAACWPACMLARLGLWLVCGHL